MILPINIELSLIEAYLLAYNAIERLSFIFVSKVDRRVNISCKRQINCLKECELKSLLLVSAPTLDMILYDPEATVLEQIRKNERTRLMAVTALCSILIYLYEGMMVMSFQIN